MGWGLRPGSANCGVTASSEDVWSSTRNGRYSTETLPAEGKNALEMDRNMGKHFYVLGEKEGFLKQDAQSKYHNE